MSAYLVEDHHITYIVAAAIILGVSARPIVGDPEALIPGINDAKVCRALYRANLASLRVRYPESERSWDVPEFDLSVWHGHQFDLIQVVKSVDCLNYQCSQVARWESQPVAIYLRWIRSRATKNLDGYDKAIWGAPVPGHAEVAS